MVKQLSILMFLAVAAAWVCPAGAEDSWSLSKLNPFKKKPATEERVQASFSDEAATQGKFPRLTVPSWASRSHTPPPREEPSTLAKLNQGTKDLYGKTKSILMPWTNDSKKKSSSKSRKSKESFFTSWLPKKEEKKSKTVKDFLAQPRPGY